MKKTLILFLSLFCLTSVASLFAANPVTVKSGDVTVLKQSSTALLEVDFSAAKVGSQSFEEYLQNSKDKSISDLSDAKNIVETYFTARFNYLNKKKMQITTDAENAGYKIMVHVRSLDMGNDAGVFVPFAPATAGGVVINGTIDIIDMSTEKVVCTLNASDVKGSASPSIRFRIELAFQELASCICKLK
jgi:hypothetical protein